MGMSSERFAGQVVLVTGGATGIGFGIARRFAREGARIVISGRNRDRGEAAMKALRAEDAECDFHQADLAVEADVVQLIERITTDCGRLDVVVNNAGVGVRRSSVERTDDPGTRWQKMRGPNLDAPYFVSAHALPWLAQSRGSIVNISSTAAWHGNWGLYGVAKAGVEALTRAFAAEAGPHGVRVNGISPGWIATEIDAEAPAAGAGEWEMPPSLLQRVGTPDEIAAAAAFLASAEAAFITAHTLVVDGGLLATDYPSMAMLSERADIVGAWPTGALQASDPAPPASDAGAASE